MWFFKRIFPYRCSHGIVYIIFVNWSFKLPFCWRISVVFLLLFVGHSVQRYSVHWPMSNKNCLSCISLLCFAKLIPWIPIIYKKMWAIHILHFHTVMVLPYDILLQLINSAKWLENLQLDLLHIKAYSRMISFWYSLWRLCMIAFIIFMNFFAVMHLFPSTFKGNRKCATWVHEIYSQEATP